MMTASVAVLLLLCGAFVSQTMATSSCVEGCHCFRIDGLKAANCSSLVDVSAIASHLKILRVEQTHSVVKAGSFSLFVNLKRLYLDHDGIHLLESGAFRGLHQLEVLDLSHNHLNDLAGLSETLLDLPRLHKLRLRGNPLRNFQSASSFLTSKTLTFLDLGLCKIHTLPNDAFRKLTNLKHLKLDKNHITTLKASTFPHTIATLDLSENNISDVVLKELLSLKNLERFELSGNPIHCTCHFLDIRGEYAMDKPVVCKTPEEYKGMNLMDVERDDICGSTFVEYRSKRQVGESGTDGEYKEKEEDPISESENDDDDPVHLHSTGIDADEEKADTHPAEDAKSAKDKTQSAEVHELADEGLKVTDHETNDAQGHHEDDNNEEETVDEKDVPEEDGTHKEAISPEQEDVHNLAQNDDDASGSDKSATDVEEDIWDDKLEYIEEGNEHSPEPENVEVKESEDVEEDKLDSDTEHIEDEIGHSPENVVVKESANGHVSEEEQAAEVSKPEEDLEKHDPSEGPDVHDDEEHVKNLDEDEAEETVHNDDVANDVSLVEEKHVSSEAPEAGEVQSDEEDLLVEDGDNNAASDQHSIEKTAEQSAERPLEVHADGDLSESLEPTVDDHTERAHSEDEIAMDNEHVALSIGNESKNDEHEEDKESINANIEQEHHDIDDHDKEVLEDTSDGEEEDHDANVMDIVDASSKLVDSFQDSKEGVITESPIAEESSSHEVPLLGASEAPIHVDASGEEDSIGNEDNPDGEDEMHSLENSEEKIKLEAALEDDTEGSVVENEISSGDSATDGKDDIFHEHTGEDIPVNLIESSAHAEEPEPSEEPTVHVISTLRHEEDVKPSAEVSSNHEHLYDDEQEEDGSQDEDNVGPEDVIDNTDAEESLKSNQTLSPKSEEELESSATDVHEQGVPSVEDEEIGDDTEDEVDNDDGEVSATTDSGNRNPIFGVMDVDDNEKVEPSEDELELAQDYHASSESETEAPANEHASSVEEETQSPPHHAVFNVENTSLDGDGAQDSEDGDGSTGDEDPADEFDDNIHFEKEKDESPLEANTSVEDTDHVDGASETRSESPIDNEQDTSVVVHKDDFMGAIPEDSNDNEGSGDIPELDFASPEDTEINEENDEEDNSEGSGIGASFNFPGLIDDNGAVETSSLGPDVHISTSTEGSGMPIHHHSHESSTVSNVEEEPIIPIRVGLQDNLPPREDIHTTIEVPVDMQDYDDEIEKTPKMDEVPSERGRMFHVPIVEHSSEVPQTTSTSTSTSTTEASVVLEDDYKVDLEIPTTNHTHGEIKVSVNELGVSSSGAPESSSPTKASNNSEGSYVVLGVIMVVIVLLLGYSVFRSRRQKGSAQKKEKDVENPGRELQDVSKPLIGNGHGPEKPPLDDTQLPLMPEEEQLDDEDEKKSRVGNGVSPGGIVTPDSEKKDVPEVVVEKSPPSVPVSTNPFRNQARDDSPIPNMYGPNNDTTDDDVFTNEPATTPRSTRPFNGVAMVNGNGLGSFQEPSVSPSSGRVRVVAKELPDSVAKRPVFITKEV